MDDKTWKIFFGSICAVSSYFGANSVELCVHSNLFSKVPFDCITP